MRVRILTILVVVTCSAAVRAQPIVVDAGNSPFTVGVDTTADSLSVAAGATLILNAHLTVAGDALVQGTVTHAEENPNFHLDVQGTLTVPAGGLVSAAGLGLGAGNNGSSFTPQGEQLNPLSLIVEPGSGFYNGGSHGGVGGLRDGGQVPPSAAYGNQETPQTFGGGGGAGGCGGNFGGKGGGRLRITAGNLSVDGQIVADGQNGSAAGCPGGGAGAGGSVLINVLGNFTGAGSIRAEGGDGTAGGGGGGRVSIRYATSTYTGGLSAVGGAAIPSGADGSVHVVDVTQNILTVQGGIARIDSSDTFAAVVLKPGGNVHIAGAANVTAPIIVEEFTRVTVESSDALDNLSIDPVVLGTLRTVTLVDFPTGLTLNGGSALIINDSFSVAGDLNVEAGATVTHDIRTNDAALNVSGTLHIEAGGFVNVSGRGLPAFVSIAPQTLLEVGTPATVGGSHGGRGGNGGLGAYGDARDPVLLGSGGGGGFCGGNFPGAGGGALAITAGTLRVDGLLQANGTNAALAGCPGGGGGSGGSLRIQVSALEGIGVIEARGGDGFGGSGAGSGGRVSIRYTSKTFSGVISALTRGDAGAEPGTVYLEDAAGNLTAEGGVLQLGAGDVFPSVTLRQSALLVLTGPADIAAPVTIIAGSTVRLDASDALQDVVLNPSISGSLIVNAAITLPSSTTVNSNGGSIVVNDVVTVTGDLIVNGVITHAAQQTDAALDVSGTLRVNAGGFIDLNGRGLPVFRTIDPLTLLEVGVPFAAGGSHGGRGGNGGTASYDDARDPRMPGSGGGPGACGGNFAGSGGGVLAITADVLRVDGILRADGTDGSVGAGCPGGGGASGGSIRAQVNRFEGTNGLVSARGGAGGAGGAGAGSGGRIAIYFNVKTFSGIVSALAGSSGAAAEHGTVYMQDAAGALTGEGGVLSLSFGDSFPSVTLRPAAILSLDGPANVTNVINIPGGTTVRINTTDALEGVSLNPTIGGTLIVNADASLPSNTTVNGTMILNALLNITGDFTVAPAGLLTHDQRDLDAQLNVSNRVRVATGGIVDLNGKGLPVFRSTDPQTLQEVNTNFAAGGSHGGRGGNGGFGSYDDLREPRLPGSGGGPGACGGNFAGAGGGVLYLIANILDVDGIIRADGHDGSVGAGCPGGGGGGGGSLRFEVSTFEGTNGLVSARGGAGGAGGAGAGGGGRISIEYTTKTFTGVVSATSQGQAGGENGTVYMEDGVTDLVAEAGVLPLGAQDSYNSVTLRPGAVVVVNGAATVTEVITIPAGTTVVLNTADALDNISLNPLIAGTLVVNAPTPLPSTTTLQGQLVLNNRLDVTGDFIVLQNGVVTHDVREVDARLDVTGLVHIRTGGMIDLNGRGLPATRTIDPLTLLEVGTPFAAGGSHGGRGGGNTGFFSYGDPVTPLLSGSGGGPGACGGNFPGSGGGVLELNADTLRLDGIIRADGTDGSVGAGCPGGGGGGGGSLRIDVDSFEGTGGLLTAKGGAAGAGGAGGGGGGRIAMTFDTKTFQGVVSALSTRQAGAQDGTVHLLDPAGNLIVEAGMIHLDEDEAYTSVTLGPQATLSLEGPAIIDNPVSVPAGTALLLLDGDSLDNVLLDPNIGGSVHVAADMVIDDDIVLSGAMTVDKVLQLRSLEMLQNAQVTHSQQVFTMNLVVSGTLVMRPGSRINADGKGFLGGPQAGFGNNGATIDPLTLQVAPGSGAYNGGSHTTQGGLRDGNQPLAAAYDDPDNPVYGGGGGGTGSCGGNFSGNGGGVVRVAAGALVVDGIISADGGAGSAAGCPGGGGGAGGSVVLAVGALSGSGAMFVRGGNGPNGGAGAGGVLKITYASDTYAGVQLVDGGTGVVAGSPGETSEGVENTAPTIVSVPPTAAQIGVVFRYRPFATGAAPLTWTLVEGPAGANVNATSGEVTWTPPGSGIALFLIRVQNALGNDEQAFQLDPIGPPLITSSAVTNGFVGVPYLYDADGRAEATGDEPIIWAALIAPNGFSIGSASGLISWVPDANGEHGVCIVATNAAGEDIQCFTVEVTPQGPPVFTSVANTVAEQFAPYLYDADATATAVGPPPIAYSIVEAPAGFDIDEDTGAVDWTPTAAGDFDVTLRAENALGFGEQSFTINVLPEGDSAAPVIVESANPLAAVDIAYVYDGDSALSSGGAGPITWEVLQGPDDFRVDAGTGLVTWLPDTAGLVTVTVRATNGFGSDEYTFDIDVLDDPGPAPTAVARVEPLIGDAPLTVTADGSGSFARPGRDIAFYRWTFGDGTAPSSDNITTHTYERPGSYVARLLVTEAIGTSGEASVVVRVSDEGVLPPAARILVSQVTGRDDLEVSFSCECDDGDSPIAAFLWDFGDGDQSDLPVVSHTFGPGSFEVRLTVVDGNGLTATDTVQIRVSDGENQPPLVVASATPTFGSAPLNTAFLATYGDVDGTIESVAWEFGEGGTAADPAPQYTYAAPGTYLAGVLVTDDQGLTASASVEIDVANEDGTRPPQILSLPNLKGAVGKDYKYDEDGLPAARGDRPLTWSLGKRVGGETVGAPAGMEVDATTGQLTWKPSDANGAKVQVTLVATNAAASVSQDWEVEVSGVGGGGGGGPDGCGCNSASHQRALPVGGAVLSALVVMLRRRRR